MGGGCCCLWFENGYGCGYVLVDCGYGVGWKIVRRHYLGRLFSRWFNLRLWVDKIDTDCIHILLTVL